MNTPLAGPALAYARKNDRAAFLSRVREVYMRTRSVPKAAVELEVGERTLFRWLDAHPELREEARAGRPLDVNGRPKRT